MDQETQGEDVDTIIGPVLRGGQLFDPERKAARLFQITAILQRATSF
jgi:hypothetical protein